MIAIHPSRVLPPAIAFALLAGIVHAELPVWNRPRAELLDRWRADLEQADAERASGQTDAAEQLYRGVLAEAGEEPNLLAARAVDGLADLYLAEGRNREAVPLYVRSVTLWKRLLGPNQPRLAVSLHQLGIARARSGDEKKARADLEHALSIWASTLGESSAEAESTRRVLAGLDPG